MNAVLYDYEKMLMICVLSRPGSDLLSRVLRQSTIGAGAFHGRVRNGIGCSRSAITTRSAKNTNMRSWLSFVQILSCFQALINNKHTTVCRRLCDAPSAAKQR